MHYSIKVFHIDSILTVLKQRYFVLQKAVNLMSQVPKLCNDMMNLGRLQGYEVQAHYFLTF